MSNKIKTISRTVLSTAPLLCPLHARNERNGWLFRLMLNRSDLKKTLGLRRAAAGAGTAQGAAALGRRQTTAIEDRYGQDQKWRQTQGRQSHERVQARQ